MGHIVSKNGIEVDPKKVKALVLLPTPKDTKQLANFIQKVKYMLRFISLSSQLLYPLQQVAKHELLHWNNEGEEVFQQLKEVLGSMLTPLLGMMPLVQCYCKRRKDLNACDQSIVLVE